jgi:hypothetical protein
LATYRENVNRETHHCNFVAAVCTLRPARVPIILTTFDTIAITHHLRGVVQAALVLKVRLRVTRRYTHLVRLGRDAEQSGTWDDQALPVSPSLAKASCSNAA